MEEKQMKHRGRNIISNESNSINNRGIRKRKKKERMESRIEKITDEELR